MPDVTRAEFDALVHRVNLLDGKGAPAPVPPTSGITLGKPVVKVSKGTYAVVAKATPHENLTAVFFQIAVRGPGAKDLALHPGQKFAQGHPVTLNASASGPQGTYTAFLAYSKDGTTWVEGPKTTFLVTETGTAPPPVSTPPADGTRRIAVVGHSGLGFNSIVFRSDPGEATAFGDRRGTPVDGLLTFAPRQSWQDLRYMADGIAQFAQAGNIVVNSMPHAPESDGDSMNQRGANDDYRDEQRDLGRYLTGAGLNLENYVIRIDWECNGDWYAWSANRSGGAEALKQAIRNYVINVRAGGLTKARFDLCFNKGPSQAGHDFDIFPGAEFIDVVGVDQYDMWSPSFNDSDWQRELGKSPSMKSCAEFATTNGIMWSLDEGGNTHGDEAQGGDNPFYWEAVRRTIDVYGSNMAWHNTYDDPGAPSSLAHDFNHNPASWPVYKRLWSPA